MIFKAYHRIFKDCLNIGIGTERQLNSTVVPKHKNKLFTRYGTTERKRKDVLDCL